MSNIVRSNDELNALANGKELVENGTDLVSTRGWTPYSSSILEVDNGRLKITAANDANGVGYQSIQTVVGNSYEISYDYTQGTNTSGYVWVGTGLGASGAISTVNLTTSKPFSYTFVAVSTVTNINFDVTDTNTYAYFNNISVKEIPKVQGENLPDYVANRLNFANIPTSDPLVNEAIWNNVGVLTISTGV